MIRLKDTKHANTAEFLGNAIRIAEYYGFMPLDEMKPARLDRESEKRRAAQAKNETEIAYARRDERSLAQIARKCVACARGNPAGTMLWRVTTGAGGIPATTLELHVLGSTSAISEALLLIVADAIAEEAGIQGRSLAINNIGSHESSNRFLRDIGTYLRKHIESISPTLRPRAATDPLGTLVQLIEKGHPAAPRAPQSMEYLTEDERRRFWDLLEYLEVFGLSYELTPSVLGSRDCWSHSLYELGMLDPETGARIAFAFGGRYDPLATRFHTSHMPAAVISINCEIRGKTKVTKEVRGVPSIYYAHLGPEARRKTLRVLESLRHAEIPVHQSLLYDRIGEQMQRAKELAVPYIVIMGYKEAMENSVLVREVATNAQDAVPIEELANYLRRRRMGSWKTLSASL